MIYEVESRISGLQMMAILIMIRTVPVISIFPLITGAEQPQDTILSSVLSALLALFPIMLIVHMCNKFPGKTIIEYSRIILGKFLGSLVALVLIWFWLHAAANSLRKISEAYSSMMMPETPMLAFVIIMSAVGAYAARNGLETIARVAELVLPAVILSLLIALALPYTLVDFDNLSPMLAKGWRTAVDGSITSLAFYSQFIIIGMIIPYLDKYSSAAKFTLFALIACLVFITATTFVLVGVYGGGANLFTFPLLNLVRMVRIADFIERIESILMAVWVFTVAISVGIHVWAASVGLVQVMKFLNFRLTVLLLSAVSAMLSIVLYGNMIEFLLFYKPKSWGYYSISVNIGILCLLFVVAFIRRISGKGAKKR